MPPNNTVTVELDRPRRLRYSMRAVEAIERETGGNIFDPEFWVAMSGTDFVTVVWAGLLHEDQDVDRDVVLDNVDMSDMRSIQEKLRDALDLEDVEEEADADPKPEPEARSA